MAISNRLKNQHLLWRAAFGPMAENTAALDELSQNKLWELLLKTSSKKPQKIAVANNLVDGLVEGVKDLSMQSQLSKEQKGRMKRQQSRADLKNMNLLWMDQMINSQAQLREKMSLFWHNHFSCRVVNSFFQQELLHVIRTNALGNFGQMLKEVSRCPSMLQFLNNQQNKKGRPNENFAREVMELFTMGRGNYTEQDIKEAARAFTGWGFNAQGEFVFRKNQHDNDNKTVLGKTGNFDGDDILNILLEQPQTAVYITKKLYRYLVNEQTDDKNIQWLAQRFYDNNYDITKLLTDIFTSDWFYAEKNIGNKIKSPIDLMVGIRRFLPMELERDESQLLFQKILGQILFYPPNVAGWPGGRTWIDSSTLMVRLQLPQVLAAKESINITAKNDDDVNMGMVKEEQLRINRNKAYVDKGASGEIDWSLISKAYVKTARENLSQKIADSLLQTSSRVAAHTLDSFITKDSRENFIKTTIIQLMATPEYQLC
ncbi:MAG TPA: DUF1800 domain-containing protein [Ferruginibacter sp.]|nr:DUF1800 domain-containing protein [Ferruginibacter sp.]HRE63014.1 DUF1800 domain-containing protein [Ferruginibacter sp.]